MRLSEERLDLERRLAARDCFIEENDGDEIILGDLEPDADPGGGR